MLLFTFQMRSLWLRGVKYHSQDHRSDRNQIRQAMSRTLMWNGSFWNALRKRWHDLSKELIWLLCWKKIVEKQGDPGGYYRNPCKRWWWIWVIAEEVVKSGQIRINLKDKANRISWLLDMEYDRKKRVKGDSKFFGLNNGIDCYQLRWGRLQLLHVWPKSGDRNSVWDRFSLRNRWDIQVEMPSRQMDRRIWNVKVWTGHNNFGVIGI